MFSEVQEIQQLVTLINNSKLQEKVFEHILKRCCRVISHNEDLTDEEYMKFNNAIGSNEAEIKTVISTINAVFQECIYHVAKPNLVLEGLKSVGMKENFATVIAQVWSTSARMMVDNVRKEKALIAKTPPQNQLKSIDYSVTVRLGTNSDERIQRKLEPTVIFNLGGNDSRRNVEDVVFEAEYNALYDLYQNLECIQEKLDELKA